MKKIMLRVYPEEPSIRKVTEFTEKDEFHSLPVNPREIPFVGDLKKFNQKSLMFVCGNALYQFSQAVPVVRYEADEGNMINGFITSITVYRCNGGRKVSLDGCTVKSDEIKDEIEVVLYQDNKGHLIAVEKWKLFNFLLQMPNTLITKEGVIIFYTESDVIATTDLHSYKWLDIPGMKLDSVYYEWGEVQIESITEDGEINHFMVDFKIGNSADETIVAQYETF